MRVAVVDIGTNSTRLLIADVDASGEIAEVDRQSVVTRLGQGVDSTGVLAEEAMSRVFDALSTYDLRVREHGADVVLGVLTSAVRDASNGADFTALVRERHGIEARAIGGDEEAALTFLGATSARDANDPTPLVVIDIGGGSTELVVGRGGDVSFHISMQAGVVRHTERYIAHDPPKHDELEAIATEVRELIRNSVPEEVRDEATAAIGVAGTATSLGAIALELEPYDSHAVEGLKVLTADVELMLAQLATVDLEKRRETKGLHPDRAPTILAGAVILIEVLRAFGLEEFEVSERDILLGVAIAHARR